MLQMIMPSQGDLLAESNKAPTFTSFAVKTAASTGFALLNNREHKATLHC